MTHMQTPFSALCVVLLAGCWPKQAATQVTSPTDPGKNDIDTQQIVLTNKGRILPLNNLIKRLVWKREDNTAKFYVYVLPKTCKEGTTSTLQTIDGDPLDVIEPVGGKVTCTLTNLGEYDFVYYFDKRLNPIIPLGPTLAAANHKKKKTGINPEKGAFSARVGGCKNCVP